MPTWKTSEEFVRDEAQPLAQRGLKEQVTELPGRSKCERRDSLNALSGYRNG